MKGLTDKYETDELHIPNMFQGTIKVYYWTVITILSLIFIFIMNFFKRPFFEASQNIQKMAKFNGYKTFLVPKSLKQKLQRLKA
jgi:magnesium-transporting ATPase (P-type)